jgi:hypothetical protein
VSCCLPNTAVSIDDERRGRGEREADNGCSLIDDAHRDAQSLKRCHDMPTS